MPRDTSQSQGQARAIAPRACTGAPLGRAGRYLALALPLVCGCSALGLSPPELDPNAQFAAYRTPDGLAIARAEGGRSGTIDAAGWASFAPQYRVRLAGEPIGELRVPSPGRVDMRAPGGAALGDVEPSWVDGAIQLLVKVGADRLRTRRFRREGVSSGLSLLTRNAQSTLDLRGTYRGEFYDDTDAQVGWLQVRVWEPSGRRVYEGVFPSGFPVLAQAAAAIALDSEIEWILRWVRDLTRGSADGVAPR
jgi:hypothetical protein